MNCTATTVFVLELPCAVVLTPYCLYIDVSFVFSLKFVPAYVTSLKNILLLAASGPRL